MPLVVGCGILPDRAMTGPADQAICRGFHHTPRTRYGTYPTATLGVPFLGEDLGTHSYNWNPFEKNGIVYTCHAGHIDIIHVRIAADWTAYLTSTSYRHLMRGDTRFSHRFGVDRSRHHVQVSYPEGWDSLPPVERSTVAHKVALAMGPYFTFTMLTWHEVLTWHGYKCTGLPVEYDSAFSWEDSLSNLLGTVIGTRAIQDAEHPYNRAVEIAIDDELGKLGIQPARVARRASHSVKGDWFTGDTVLFVDMKKRNFDIGLGDGYVTPTIVPDVAECPDAEPISYPVPRLDVPARYGFSISVEIEPREWEKDKILRIVHGDAGDNRINPELHLARIMDHIRQQAAARYGPEYMPEEHVDQHYVYTGGSSTGEGGGAAH